MDQSAVAVARGTARSEGRAPGRPETRGERKERTRQAIMDATLALCEDSSLVALSLRQVAKEVGIVPTAFYRHFASIEDLGLALVEDSFVSLRAMLRVVDSGGQAALLAPTEVLAQQHDGAQRRPAVALPVDAGGAGGGGGNDLVLCGSVADHRVRA